MDQKPFHLKSLFLIIGLIGLAVLVILVLQQQQEIKSMRQSETNTPTNNAVEVKSDTNTTGERQLLSWPYPENTDPNTKFNNDKPDTNVKYSDKTLGFEVDLPFNEKWGTSEYKINPYEFSKESNTIRFGALGDVEGSWDRSYTIKVEDPKTEAEVKADLKQKLDASVYGDLKVIVADSFKIIQYDNAGLCSHPAAIVLGKRHTYTFQARCENSPDPAYKLFNEIIRTLKSI